MIGSCIHHQHAIAFVYKTRKWSDLRKFRFPIVKSGIFILVIILIASACFVLFTTELKKTLNEKAHETVSALSERNVRIINRKIEECFSTLGTISYFVSRQDTLVSDEVFEILRHYSQTGSISYLSFMTANGFSYLPNGSMTDLHEYPRNAALDAERRIESIAHSIIDNQRVIAFVVPIVKNNQIIGSLRSTYYADRFSDMLDTDLHYNDSLTYLIDEHGDAVNDTTLAGDITNFYNMLASAKISEGYSIARIRNDMQNSRSGFIEYTRADRTRYAFYEPVGTDNFYVITVAFEDAINAQQKHISTLVLFLMSAIFVCLSAFAVFIIFMLRRSAGQLQQSHNELLTLTNNIPGAVVKVCLRPRPRLCNTNNGFYKLTGYSPEEFVALTDNLPFKVIHPEDRKMVMRSIYSQLEKSDRVELDLRLVKKNGSSIWVSLRGTRVFEAGLPYLHCVFTDTTAQKELQQKLEIEKERYRIVEGLTQDILFEYNLETDELVFSSKFTELTGQSNVITHFSKGSPNNIEDHPEDHQQFVTFCNDIIQCKPDIRCEFRIRTPDGSYQWLQAHACTIFGENGLPLKVVGKTTNIDKHKREAFSLREKANRDSLTLLYNKSATAQLIDDYLRSDGKAYINALMIMDLDNFKTINDRFGHIEGDETLKTAAKIAMRLFRTSDIIGRFGGDEFVIFLKNMIDEQAVMKKAAELCNAMQGILVKQSLALTCSIGIAFYDTDGLTYEALFAHADTALFRAKRNGRNHFMRYES